jgi:hypothetical protein
MVGPLGVDRLREQALRLVHQHHTGGGREGGPGGLDRHGAVELDGDCLGVGHLHRHPHAGRAHADARVAQNLLRLVDDLVLFLGEPVGVEGPVEGDDVTGELGPVGGRGRDGAARRERLQLRLEIE